MTGKTWLIIPAYNVDKYIDTLLFQTVCYIPPERTIVVDDGSSDLSGEIARKHGVQVIVHSNNKGKGRSLRDGLELVMQNGGDWAITIDGDCQHDPAKIPAFLSAGESDKYDIIIGNRHRSGTKMPWDRKLSNMLSSAVISVVTGQKIDDVQCGYRMIRISELKDFEFKAVSYDFETELLLKMVRKGARIGQVDIPTRYNGEASSIRRMRDTIRFIKLVSLYLIRRI